MVLEVPPQDSISANKVGQAIHQLNLQRQYTKHSQQVTRLAQAVGTIYEKWFDMNREELLEELKKEEALLDSLKTAMETEELLKKEKEKYEAEQKAAKVKALKELIPKWAMQ